MQEFKTHDLQSGDSVADETRLVEATTNGDSEKVLELLVKGIPTTVTDNVGLTLLMIGSKHGHTEIVRHLIQAGADVNLHGILTSVPMRVTALWFAANYGKTDVVKILLDAGADLNDWVGDDKDMGKSYPLIAASYGGHVEVLKLLLASGAHVNRDLPIDVIRKQGMHAKSKKKYKQYVEVVNLLLTAGAK